MLVVALQHLSANELSEECRDEDRQTLHPTAFVKKAESGTGHARGRRVGEGVVAGVHLLDLFKLGLEVLDGLVGAQVVDDAAQCLQATDVDADPTHFAGLGAETVADVGGGDDLGHRHGRLVAVEADSRGGPGHGGLDAVGAGTGGEHEPSQVQHDVGLLHEPIGIETRFVAVARWSGREVAMSHKDNGAPFRIPLSVRSGHLSVSDAEVCHLVGDVGCGSWCRLERSGPERGFFVVEFS